MFADPITVTVAGVAKVMGRVSTNGTSAVYATADGIYQLTISHQRQSNGRIRTVSRLDFKKIVTNPLDSTNDWDTISHYTVEERPAFGFTSTEIKDNLNGFTTWLVLTATQDKLLATES